MINYTDVSFSGRKAHDDGLRQYMIQVYNLMSLGLILSATTAFLTLMTPMRDLMFQVSPDGIFLGFTGMGMLFSFAPLLIGLYFSFGFGSMNYEKSKTMFWIYAAVSGISLSYVGLVYTGVSILKTMFITAATFAAMSIYGHTTKRDLTNFGSFLIMGLIGIMIAGIVNIFFQSPAIYFITSIIGVFIFIGLIAWDTQQIKSYYYLAGGGEMGKKMAVMGAFQLYLDVINLFIHLLRFFGNRKE